MNIAVIGAGYVGLTTAACFAHLGHDVVCADIDAERVARLGKGEMPILEEGLPALVAEGLASRRLAFVVGAANAAARTPSSCSSACRRRRATTASADLSFVEAVAREIAPVLRAGHRRRQQVDDAGRLDPARAARARRVGRRARATSASRRTPSSSARARRCATSSTRTAS